MKQLSVWLLVVAVLSVLVFSGVIFTFDHFWQAWEFLAAATAAVYNLFFAIVVYASREEKGEGTLHAALGSKAAVATHLILRVSLPSFFFVGTMVVVLWDRQIGTAPVPGHSVLLKLGLTLVAFLTVCAGDFVTERQLAGVTLPDYSSPHGWIKYFKTRVWLIDLPFVVGYIGLICIYAMYRYDPRNASRPEDSELLIQAFVGGASALEMMIQSAIHGFSEIGD